MAEHADRLLIHMDRTSEGFQHVFGPMANMLYQALMSHPAVRGAVKQQFPSFQ